MKENNVPNRQTWELRQSNFELLRIVAMVLIVFSHFAVHSQFEYADEVISIPRLWQHFMSMGGKVGVNCFILISGYFMTQDSSTKPNIEKVLKLWGQVYFYSIVLLAFCKMLGAGEPIALKEIGKSLMPIVGGRWWFASTYFVLYILHPYLNQLLNGMDKNMYQRFLLTQFLIWSVIPTFLISDFQSNELLWFCFLYSFAGYSHRYGLSERFVKSSWCVVAICATIMYATDVLLMLIGLKWRAFLKYTTHFYEMQSIFNVLLSVGLFTAFSNLKVRYSKRINQIASASFGVYLIHDHFIFREFLWNVVFQDSKFQDSLVLIPYSIMVVMVVYVVCSLLELFRQSTIEKRYLHLVRRYSDYISDKLIKIEERFCNLILSKDV